MNCRIGRKKECELTGCAYNRAGITPCSELKEIPILPKFKTKIAKVKPKEYKCYYCNKPLREKQVTKDHVIAKSLGGNGHRKNLVDCCKLCNTFKSNMTIEQFTFKLQTMLNNISNINK